MKQSKTELGLEIMDMHYSPLPALPDGGISSSRQKGEMDMINSSET